MVQLMRRFALCAALLLAACEDEAMMHPPIPPSTAIPELGAASQPATQAASAPVVAPAAPQLTMAQLMSERIEPAARKVLTSKKPDAALDHWLKIVMAQAPEDPKFRAWTAMTQNSMKAGRYAQGCRQCHAAYLRPYKKKFHDVTFPAPADTYP